jgi:putative transcriptional regulator
MTIGLKPAPTDAEIAAWAAEDPDMAAALATDWQPVEPTLARQLRQRLNLTQTEFAARYGIPVSAIRAWEIGRHQPNAAVAAYLLAIAGDPDGVAKAFVEGNRLAAQ